MALTLTRTMAEISWAENCLDSPRYWTSTLGLPLSSTTLKGQDSMSFLTVGSSKRRPIRRLKIMSAAGGSRWQDGQGPSRDNLLDIEDGVDGVHGGLVLGSLTDQSLGVSEGDERRGGEGTLLVGDDLDIAALVGGHTGVGGTCCDDGKS